MRPVIERDYIMRMIAMLTAVIAKVLNLKEDREYPAALREIDRGLRSLLGLDGRGLDAFSESQLLEMFGRDPQLAPVRWYALGILLMERAELLSLEGQDSPGGGGATRALRMLLESFLSLDAEVDPGHRGRITAMLERCSHTALTESTLLKVAEFHESVGAFAKAEDVYYELAERAPDASARLLEFYHRLLKRTDAELTAGNLPRSEVLEGIGKLTG